MQELLVTLIRKGIAASQAGDTVLPYRHWRVVDNTAVLFASAVAEMLRWRISLWDAMILAAARNGGANQLWTEDLSEGQDYDGIRVVNPLLTTR